jgi:L-ribulose-5-phosphate 3-epimerase UlaE
MLRMLSEIPELTYTHDTGNLLPSLEDPVEMLEVFKDKLVGLHMKDFAFSDIRSTMTDACGRNLQLVPYGTGIVDFKAIMKVLK